MNQPLLSVIVPCYNVEKYVNKCILSIVGQTYTNLEILLIDDGSTDNTGKICDEWQERDPRIRVIHKQNEGTSYARKTGVENASADYVTFVDADDWIDTNMYADMLAALLTTNSDIAHCDFCIVNEDGRTEHRVQERDATIKTMGRIEGVIMVLEDNYWRTHLGLKIYKKTLFEHIEFPKGRVYGEDMIIHDLFHLASQSVFLDKEYYYYFVRSGSISRQEDIRKKMKNTSDFSDACYDRYSFVKRHPEYHGALPHIKNLTIFWNVRVLRNMIVYPQLITDKQFDLKAEQLRNIPFNKEDNLELEDKIDMYMLKISPTLFKFLKTINKKAIRITNKLKITDKYLEYFI